MQQARERVEGRGGGGGGGAMKRVSDQHTQGEIPERMPSDNYGLFGISYIVTCSATKIPNQIHRKNLALFINLYHAVIGQCFVYKLISVYKFIIFVQFFFYIVSYFCI